AGAAQLACKPRRQWAGSAGEAEVGAPKAALRHQGANDLAGRGVDRDGQAEADARYGGVDPYDPCATVRERTAGVAGIERGVGLDDVVDDANVRAGPRRQRPSERRDDACGDGAGEAVRVPD